MDKIEMAKWIIAAFFWSMSLIVLFLNIRRQFQNRSFERQNIEKRISGIPFLFTIFLLLEIAACPIKFYWILIPGLIFEIPAIADFRISTEDND